MVRMDEEAFKLLTLVKPEGSTAKKLLPEVEATFRIGRVWAEVEACTTKVPQGVELLMPNSWLVLIQAKLEEPAKVLAPL